MTWYLDEKRGIDIHRNALSKAFIKLTVEYIFLPYSFFKVHINMNTYFISMCIYTGMFPCNNSNFITALISDFSIAWVNCLSNRSYSKAYVAPCFHRAL